MKTITLELTINETEIVILGLIILSVVKMPTKELAEQQAALRPACETLTAKISDAQKMSGLWEKP